MRQNSNMVNSKIILRQIFKFNKIKRLIYKGEVSYCSQNHAYKSVEIMNNSRPFKYSAINN